MKSSDSYTPERAALVLRTLQRARTSGGLPDFIRMPDTEIRERRQVIVERYLFEHALC